MKNENKHAVLVVGHGSRREEANEDVRQVAQRIGERGGFPLIQAAFLEIAHPNIHQGIANLVAQGASSITVHPYFLSPGRHTRGDIPVEVSAAAAEFPNVSFKITEPLAGHDLVVEASIERINETQNNEEAQTPNAKRGKVYIVGGGPGDAGLLTVKAHNLLRSCDVVIYDYLVNPEILRLTSSKAEHIYVGKVGGGSQTPQTEINQLLIELAKRGESVVRLKGGDPFIFGRGAEEAEALRAASIEFEIIPGISSATAVPAYAGIPLTHRSLSASFAVVTGARAGEGESLAHTFAGLSSVDTLVILMGVSRLRKIVEELIEAGRSPETPAAVIRWGTYEGQEVVSGNLQTIADEVEKAKLRSPAVIVIGEVVALRERLNWFQTDVTNYDFEEDFEFATEVVL